MRRFQVHNRWALGDTVIFSALARDLYIATDGEYRIRFTQPAGRNSYISFWENNPYVASWAEPAVRVDLGHRAGIDAAKAGAYRRHFMTYIFEIFSKATGIKVLPLQAKGDIHLSATELVPPVSGRYWTILAGYKSGMPAKAWPASYWQDLVDRLASRGIRCVQLGAAHDGVTNFQPKLTGVLDLTGRTPSIRDMFRVIRHAEGVVCGITSGMHIAAVWDKPCVVVAGGREPWTWIAYADVGLRTFGDACAPVAVPHRFLHTTGLLSCAKPGGCWKRHVGVVPRRQGKQQTPSLCERPLVELPTVAECMGLITPDIVEEAVMSYYGDHTIPPITPTGAAPAVSVLAPKPEIVKTTPAELDGWFTVFVLAYGDFTGLIQRCIESLTRTSPQPGFLDIRVGANAVCPATSEYLRGLLANGTISRLYWHEKNDYKYPVMREMLADTTGKPVSPYFVWFDDDSYVASPDLWPRLMKEIKIHHPSGVRMIGRKYFNDIGTLIRKKKQPLNWFKAAPWWKNRPLRIRGTQKFAPNGTCIDFVPGSFWAAHYETFVRLGIPDPRLLHNGGDIAIGAQLHQAGFTIREFDTKDTLVHRTKSPRRGYSEDFPWAK